jgi:hypothetical protein
VLQEEEEILVISIFGRIAKRSKRRLDAIVSVQRLFQKSMENDKEVFEKRKASKREII